MAASGPASSSAGGSAASGASGLAYRLHRAATGLTSDHLVFTTSVGGQTIRGTGDQSCTCGAWYNTAGQQLRDDWTHNPAWRDNDVDDMEGYEQACLRNEAHTR